MPSVYATGQGGGAGDARINVRGFNNVAVMINGVLLRYGKWLGVWSIGMVLDATTSIQLQKGLSAQNLATPSIGGSMNMLPMLLHNKGGSFKQIGAWGFKILSYHSGLLMTSLHSRVQLSKRRVMVIHLVLGRMLTHIS